MRFVLAGFLFVAAVGCSTDPAVPRQGAQIDLRAAIGAPDVKPVGVTVDPTGARYVLDEELGLFRLDGATATLVLGAADFPDPGVPVRLPFTDLVAIGEGQFAITALGEGFRLDLAAHTMASYFCYVPDGLPEDYDQRTDAVAYDAAADKLYAQPRTFDAAGTLLASQMAEYNATTGIDFGWTSLENQVASRGMVVLPDRGLAVADGYHLYVFDGFQLQLDLDLYTSTGGLGYDAAESMVLVVDDHDDRLVEIPLEELTFKSI